MFAPLAREDFNQTVQIRRLTQNFLGRTGTFSHVATHVIHLFWMYAMKIVNKKKIEHIDNIRYS